jgi:Domain of unknown function (DUF4349)
MRSPEIEPARLERLLAGFAPETAQEAILQGLVRELRGGMAEAPLALRERVRMICDPVSPRRVFVTRRRLVAVALTAALVAVIGAVAIKGEGGSDGASVSESPTMADEKSGFAPLPAHEAVPQSEELNDAMRSSGVELQAAGATEADASKAGTIFGTAPSARAQDVKMTMAIRVPDADALSDATNAALALTTELGGHVVASNVDTDGSSGEAQLRLSIPVGKIEDAVVRLSALGAITHQNVQTVDLQGKLDARAKQAERLQRAIEADELRIASGTLTAEEKLMAELRLAENRADLRDVRRVRAALAKQAANAELALTLRTGSTPAGSEDEGGVAGAVDDGFAFLAAAGIVALLVFIAASPLIVLAVLAWILLRTRRRRIEARVLDQPRPGAPRTAPPASE